MLAADERLPAATHRVIATQEVTQTALPCFAAALLTRNPHHLQDITHLDFKVVLRRDNLISQMHGLIG